jgi:hypothetical protein
MNDRDAILAVVRQRCASAFSALGDEQALDAANAALDGEQLTASDRTLGRENDRWALVEHVFVTANFLKVVWDVYLSAKKEGRDVTADEKAKITRSLLVPGDAGFDKSLDDLKTMRGLRG